MNLLLLAVAALVPSVGEVKVDCPAPGPWTFELVPEKCADGVDAVRVKARAAEEAPPPRFSVRWFVSQRDVHHLWTSESTHYGIPWGTPSVSDLSSWMPLYAFLDAGDRNRFTFACSESCRRVEFRSPISETQMGFNCSYAFFTSPEAPLKSYEVLIRFDARDIAYWDALGAAADWMCAAAGIEPMAAPESAFDPLYSSWYVFHQDVTAAEIEAECALAAKLGMKTAILDDGWQIDLPPGGRAWGGYRRCGDWKPGMNFPDMPGHVRRLHDLGFKYMVWFAVPFVGEKSANFERFKGKFLPVECAGGHVLDPRFPEVREFTVRTYEDAVRDWGIDGLKLDFIGRFTLKEGVVDPAVAENYAGRDIKSIPLAVDAMLTEVMRRLKAIKPDILIEFRQSYISPSIRRFGNMIRATDCPCSMVENRTRTARLRLTSGRTAVHSDMLEWRADETPESAARCILNALFSVVQYSVRLKTLPESHRRMVEHWIGFSQAHREALVKGRFRPHLPAADYPLLEGESADERVFGVYQDGLAVDVGAADRTVYVLNACNADRLVLRLPTAPLAVEAFDTFGAPVKAPVLKAGLNAAQVPVSGYLKILFPAWKVLPIFGGGFVQNVVPCPTDPDVYYTYVDVGGPYRSDDACRSWRPLHALMPIAMRQRSMDCVRTLSVDPRDADNLVIAAGNRGDNPGGLAVSRDGGRTWKVTATACFYGNGFRRATGLCLDRNPFNPDELVAGEDWSGIFVSRDNGETWRRTGPEKCWFTDIRYDLNVPGRIYATAPAVDPKITRHWSFSKEQQETVRGHGIWRSDDNGETWRKLGDRAAHEFRQIRGRSALVATFDAHSVERSDDGGETWRAWHEGLPRADEMSKDAAAWRATFDALTAVRDRWMVGDRGGQLYVRGADDKAWRELPRGKWKPGCEENEQRLMGRDRNRVSMPALGTIVVDPRNADHWFATDWFAIWETEDAGANWTSRVNGMMQLVSFTMAFDPLDAADILYGVADMRLYVSNDGGTTYRRPTREHLAGCNSAAFSSKTKGLALCAGGKERSEILRTRDGGRTWEEPALKGLPKLAGGAAGGIGAYTVAYDSRRDAFWTCLSGKIAPGAGGPYVSFDAGESWEWKGEGLPTDLDFYLGKEWGVKFTPQILFSADGTGVTGSARTRQIYRLDPAGGAWTTTSESVWASVYPFDVVADPFVPGRFLCGGAQVLESTDAARSWHPYAPMKGRPCQRIAFDAHDRGTVLFACEEEILVSRDGGATFKALDHGLEYPSGGTRRIFIDRGRIFALTSGSGVFTRRLAN